MMTRDLRAGFRYGHFAVEARTSAKLLLLAMATLSNAERVCRADAAMLCRATGHSDSAYYEDLATLKTLGLVEAIEDDEGKAHRLSVKLGRGGEG